MSLNPLKDTKITINEFGGLWNRGDNENIPQDHCEECYNAGFDVHNIFVRPGTHTTFDLTFSPVKIFEGVIDYDRFFLLLDFENRIHRDTSPDVLLDINTLNAAIRGDFSGINLYDRVYISPNEGLRGSDQDLYVYTGDYAPRKAGGAAPASPLVAAESATAGVISAGTHQIAVSYVTDTGFITPPSTLASWIADGSHSVDLSSIPTGPVGVLGGVVSRYILCTKAGETELFFVPGGLIENNTATTITLSFADTDLVVSADYLNDIYDFIPAGTHLQHYKGRLVIVGTDEQMVLISNVQDPETFSRVNGFLAVPSEGKTVNPPVSGLVLRDTLYISKFPGVYAVEEIQGEDNPNNWPVHVVDQSVGFYPNGISSFTTEISGGNTSDHAMVVTQQGILLFDGVFRRPAMSWKIEDIWKRVVQDDINNSLGTNYNFWRFTISHDVVNKKLYVNCAFEDPGVWFVLHADYSRGWDNQNVRWSQWTFPFYASAAVMSLHPTDNKYALRVASFLDMHVWTLDSDDLDDAGTAINYLMTTAPLFKLDGYLSHYIGVRIRARGTGGLTVAVSESATSVYTAASMAINSTVNREYLSLTNYVNEKARVTLQSSGVMTSTIRINRLDLFYNPAFPMRPQV